MNEITGVRKEAVATALRLQSIELKPKVYIADRRRFEACKQGHPSPSSLPSNPRDLELPFNKNQTI